MSWYNILYKRAPGAVHYLGQPLSFGVNTAENYLKVSLKGSACKTTKMPPRSDMPMLGQDHMGVITIRAYDTMRGTGELVVRIFENAVQSVSFVKT